MVHGGTQSQTVVAPEGGLIYTGGEAYDIVAGGGHPAVIVGGYGGGLYAGGGNAWITAGAGGVSIEVGGNGDVLRSAGPGTVFAATTGGDTIMSSVDSTGTSVFFGQASTDRMTFMTGAGTTLVGLGQGTNDVTLGAGNDVVFGNTGTTAQTVIRAGTGNEEIVFGGRSMDFYLTSGTAHDVYLFNFAPGPDAVHLVGYDPAGVTAALASQQQAGPGTTMNLADGTHLWFMNNSHVDATFFR